MSSGAMIPVAGSATVTAPKPSKNARGLVAFMKSRAEKVSWFRYRSAKALATTQTADMPFFDAASQTVGDGNVITPRSLPEPQLMQVKGVGIFLEEGITRPDITDINSKSYLTVNINDTKEVHAWPVRGLPAGGGQFGTIAGSAAEQVILANGVPTPEAIYWLPVPFWIKGGEQFECLGQFRAALALSATRRMEVEFHGPLWRRAFNQ